MDFNKYRNKYNNVMTGKRPKEPFPHQFKSEAAYETAMDEYHRELQEAKEAYQQEDDKIRAEFLDDLVAELGWIDLPEMILESVLALAGAKQKPKSLRAIYYDVLEYRPLMDAVREELKR